jgi:hypothetical protein
MFTAVMISGISLVAGSAANAAVITLGLQESTINGGAIKTVATGPADLGVSYDKSFGKWTFNSLYAFDGTGQDFDVEASNVTRTKGLTPLHVWFSETGLTTAIGSEETTLTSTLTQNDLPKGWTVTELTFLSPTDTVFGTAIPLASMTFTSVGETTDTFSLPPPVISNPYSLTTEFIIVLAKGADTHGDGALSTVDVNTAPIPETQSWAMMGLGFAGLGFVGFARRNRRLVASF